ncbi:MAG: heavy-metal-associated domain-containing protein [Spirochaetes bacterium]|nr:heavy-metal-associated domain-containing protein [Spirochaetota bacterium]
MEYAFNVPDMSCNHCKMRIEKTMNESGKVKEIKVDLDKKMVTLESELSESDLLKLFDDAGYDAAIRQ